MNDHKGPLRATGLTTTGTLRVRGTGYSDTITDSGSGTRARGWQVRVLLAVDFGRADGGSRCPARKSEGR